MSDSLKRHLHKQLDAYGVPRYGEEPTEAMRRLEGDETPTLTVSERVAWLAKHGRQAQPAKHVRAHCVNCGKPAHTNADGYCPPCGATLNAFARHRQE